MSIHPDNAALADALTLYGHLPITELHHDHHGSTLMFATCTDYRAACVVNSKGTPDRGRMISAGFHSGGFRLYDHLDKDGRVLAHRCWPHLECWEDKP